MEDDKLAKVTPSPRTMEKAKYLLNRLSALTSTLTGLDGVLMLAQYSSPLIIALLLRLAKLKKDGGKNLLGLAGGIAAGAGSLGDARTVMRAFGMLPILQWLLALHPKPLSAIRSLITSPGRSLGSAKTLATVQALSLMVYYPLEHLGWLSGKGIVRMSPTGTGKAILWSVRAWAVYVMIDIYKLQSQYFSLQYRTRAMRSLKSQIPVEEAEGYELTEKSNFPSQSTVSASAESTEKVMAIKKEWKAWKLASIKNTGYGPLTVHWGAGPVWTSPLITGVLGCVAAGAKLAEEWDRQG